MMATKLDTSVDEQAKSDDAEDEAVSNSTLGFRQWVVLLAAVMLALATVATAWCGYQSARWGGEHTLRMAQMAGANMKMGKFTNLAQQQLGLHVGLFSQWAAATSRGEAALAEFTLRRFPEPLAAASSAWLATQPLTNPAAPTTPFAMPEYKLAEQAEADRWEAVALAESEAAARANEIADRYLLFTVIFASVLFFAGISGKFGWAVLDVVTLAMGALALGASVLVLLFLPIK